MAVKSGDDSITKFSELAGKKVGLKQGTAAASFMKSKYKANYVEFPNIDNAYLSEKLIEHQMKLQFIHIRIINTIFLKKPFL